jgi:putative endonuclease
MAATTLLGRAGEQLAVRHLEGAGFTVLARNWRPAGAGLRGELDVVARAGRVLVVCEVKSRRGGPAADPLASVTPHKWAQLRALTAAYLTANPHRGEVRLDLIGVTWPPGGGPATLTHLPGVTG